MDLINGGNFCYTFCEQFGFDEEMNISRYLQVIHYYLNIF